MTLHELARLSVRILKYEFFSAGSLKLTLSSILLFVSIWILTSWTSRLVQAALGRALKARGVASEPGALGAARRLTHYAVMLVGLGIALQTIGVNLSALFAAGAVFAVGIGFAIQTLAENFVSGLLLLIEQAIVPGDVLELNGKLVTVQQMSIRSTRVLGPDDEEIIVPNSNLVKNEVKNFARAPLGIRVRAQVGVEYDSDMRYVKEVLLKAAASLQNRNQEKPPVAQLVNFSASSVDWEVSVWISDPQNRPARRAELNEVLWHALKGAGIVIAYPHLEVHLDEEELKALRESTGAASPFPAVPPSPAHVSLPAPAAKSGEASGDAKIRDHEQ